MTQKILVVDDEPQAVRMLGFVLDRAGYQVISASSGIEALEKIGLERPDLVILDVMMPGMDGYEVCRRIRESPETADLPVMMLTAMAQVDNKVAGFSAGADDYLIKPVSMAELTARVKALLTRAGQSRGKVTVSTRAHVLAFVGVKGGVGVTTLAINIALAITEAGKATILADLHPQGGAVAAQLHWEAYKTLENLLEQESEAIVPDLLRNCMLTHQTGLRILPAPAVPTAQPSKPMARHVEAIINQLSGMAPVLILDLESAVNPFTQAALGQADHIILVTEADSLALQMTKRWQNSLQTWGIGGPRVGVAVVNRGRAAIAYGKTQLDEMFGSSLLGLIGPAPEACLKANETGIPILLQQQESVVDAQIRTLAQRLVR